MNKRRLLSLVALAASALVSFVLELLFLALLFHRDAAGLVPTLGVGLPLFLVGLLVAAWVLDRHLAPVWTSTDPSIRRRLARASTLVGASNLILFVPVTLATVGLTSSAARPFPGPLDLMLITGLSLAFGFVSLLQTNTWLEQITAPDRRRLGLTDVAPGEKELGLRTRLLLVNFAGVLLSGLLASMAALGFYREVVHYYAGLATDGVAAASTVSVEAVDQNEFKVVVQLFVLFVAVLGWTALLTGTALGNLNRQLKLLRDRVAEMAEGSADLGRRAEVLFFDEVGLLTGRINAVMARLETVVGSIQSTSHRVLASATQMGKVSADAEERLQALGQARSEAEEALGGQGDALASTLGVAEELASSSTAVKEVAGDQSAAITQGASAMEQLAKSITEVREMTARADGLAGSLRGTSEQGGQGIEAVRRAMGAISEAAAAVAGTVASIKKTASQTNLLAMNAAIEAAHAGDSGLGFAVVASEVRSLAESSSQGAKAIGELMKDMVSRIAEGDRLATEAGAAFARIYELVVQTSEVMGTVAQAMDQQQAGAETLVTTTRTLQEAAARIAAVTDRQAGHSEALNKSVQILVETGASMAMAQEVQARSMNELAGLVRTVAHEAGQNMADVEALEQVVEGFSISARG